MQCGPRPFTLQPVKSRAHIAALACGVLLVTACATDSQSIPTPLIGPHPQYDAFLDRVQRACAGQQIGTFAVSDLINETETYRGDFFYTQTRRLYYRNNFV